MVEKPMTIQTSVTENPERLEKLEREHRLLVARLDGLQKQRNSWLPGLVGSVVLLVAAGLLLDYLGFLPAVVERLPLKAKSVDADEFILRDSKGKPWGKIHVVGQEATLTRYDGGGHPLEAEPAFPR